MTNLTNQPTTDRFESTINEIDGKFQEFEAFAENALARMKAIRDRVNKKYPTSRDEAIEPEVQSEVQSEAIEPEVQAIDSDEAFAEWMADEDMDDEAMADILAFESRDCTMDAQRWMSFEDIEDMYETEQAVASFEGRH